MTAVQTLSTEASHDRPDAGIAEDARGSRDDVQGWRLRLLPVMVSATVGLTLAFLAIAVWQVNAIQNRIAFAPDAAFGTELGGIRERLETATGPAALPASDLQARIALERAALSFRYQRASAVEATHTWMRFMSFVTGMLLALIGAFFVLGRLDGAAMRLRGEGGGFKAALSSSSPGLILATLGTALMFAAIFATADVDIGDGAAYLPISVTVRAADSAAAGLTAREAAEALRRAAGADTVHPEGRERP